MLSSNDHVKKTLSDCSVIIEEYNEHSDIVTASPSTEHKASSRIIKSEDISDSDAFDSDSDTNETKTSVVQFNALPTLNRITKCAAYNNELEQRFGNSNSLYEAGTSGLNIGNVTVNGSTDVTFGNKTFRGPITIHQIQHTNNNLENKVLDNTDDQFKDKKLKKNKVKSFWYIARQSILVTTIGATFLALVTIAYFTTKSFETNESNSTRDLVTIVGAAFLLLVTTVYLTSSGNESMIKHKTIGDGDDARLNIPIHSNIDSAIITNSAGPLRVISRSEWLAQPSECELIDLELPSTRIIIAHTATEGGSTQATCTYRVRFIQTFHIESRGFDDIGYNFLVGGDGAVYVGRGWNKQGAHTKGYNAKSICIAFVGTFNRIVPPHRQLFAAQALIREGVKLQKVASDYSLYGHRQLVPFESPGDALYAIIKTWDHWSETIL